MFEIARGHSNGSRDITDKVSRREADSALHIAMDIVYAGWTIAYMCDDLVIAEFGFRWIQIDRVSNDSLVAR